MEIYKQIKNWNNTLRKPFLYTSNCSNAFDHITLTDNYKTLIICDHHRRKFHYSISIPKEIVKEGKKEFGKLHDLLIEFWRI